MNATGVALALFIGMLLPLQALINASLGRQTFGPVFASLASFMVGTGVLLAWWLLTRPVFVPAALAKVPWWAWMGGVIGECRRAGSLDRAIVRGSERANALVPLIVSLSQLRVIAFNGATAASLFRRQVEPQLAELRQPVQRIALPSTSPAHAAMGLEALREAWSVLAPWRESSA